MMRRLLAALLLLFLMFEVSADVLEVYEINGVPVAEQNGCQVILTSPMIVKTPFFVAKIDSNIPPLCTKDSVTFVGALLATEHNTCPLILDKNSIRCACTPEFNAYWSDGFWLKVRGVDRVCFEGTCVDLLTDEGNLFLGKKNAYTVEYTCAGRWFKKRFALFPAKIDIEYVDTNAVLHVKPLVECNKLEFCVDGQCGALNVTEGKHILTMVCDGRESNTTIDVPPPPEPTEVRSGPLTIRTMTVKASSEGDTVVLRGKGTVELNFPDFIRPYIEANGRLIPASRKITVDGAVRLYTEFPKVERHGGAIVVERSLTITSNGIVRIGPKNIPGRPMSLPYGLIYAETNGKVLELNITLPTSGQSFEVLQFVPKTGIWRPIPYTFVPPATIVIKIEDNSLYDLDPRPSVVSDDIGIGTGGLVVSADLNPKFASPGETVEVYGYVEKNGTPVANNWINIYLDGTRLGGPTIMVGPSDWWDPNWKYRREINITNATGLELNDYQVKVVVDLNALYTQGKLQRTATDLRFVDLNGNVLSYWIVPVPTTITPIPQADDVSSPYTADTNCEANPTYKYYALPDPDGGAGTAEEPPGWYLPDFNDEGWKVGHAPFGGPNFAGACTPALTSAPDDLFVRKWFYIPGEPLEANLWLSIDDGVRCYINGHLVIDDITAAQGPTYWNYGPIEINVAYLHEGNNLLACWVANGGENTGTGSGYFDAKLVVVYDEKIQSDANIWIKVPHIPPGGTKIYMYYGNPNATVSTESYEDTFDTYDVNLDCSGRTPGGSCSVTFAPTNAVFFEHQKYGYGTLDFLMSGDFDYGGVYADTTTCYTGGYERVMVYLNGICYGTYSTGAQDCTDRRPPTWPKDIGSLIAGQSSLTALGDTDTAVNYDPGCGYYYHFIWHLVAKTRKYYTPEPTTTVGPEIAGTVTDGVGRYSWLFSAPTTVGEHTVRVDVNDGVDFASVTTTLYVVDGLKIHWADFLPRVKNGYSVVVESLNPSVDEVNLVLEGNAFSKTYTCTQSGSYWYCDLNMYEINEGKYILKAYGFSSGTLVAFDAKYTEAGPKKVFEFNTTRDIVTEANIDATEYNITLQRVCQDYTFEAGCWQFRRDVNVWFDGTTVEYNVQIPLRFTGNDPIFLHAREDGTDIRVVWDNNGTPVRLDYWIEEWEPTANVGIIWVKLPELRPGENILHVYYGNPTAVEGNVGPDAIFEANIWHLTAECTDSALCGYTDNHDEFEAIVQNVENGLFTIYGTGTVGEINESDNPYGPDDQYFSWFRFLFIPDTTGNWYVATDSDDASEIVYAPGDDPNRRTVVVAWYGGHGVANNWSHNAPFQMVAGKAYWFEYRYTEWYGLQAGRMAVERPGTATWLLMSAINFPGRIYHRHYVFPEPIVQIGEEKAKYRSSGYVEFNIVKPISVAMWTYLDINAEDVRDTNIHVMILDENGTTLCSFDAIPTISRYDISGCTNDKNAISVKVFLSTADDSITPIIHSITLNWIEQTNIKLIEPTEVYQFRNELMHVAGWLRCDTTGCTDVNAYLYFRTTGAPHTIEEYNYDHFITRSSDANVTIGDDLRPAYLHPNLGYYIRTITIQNNAGIELNNYAVKIVFDSSTLIAAGQMREDCGDIRITDANFNELNYWLKPGTCNTSATVVWVFVPKIPPSGTVIHLHHGRLDLTSKSNGEAVFPEEVDLNGECQGSTAGGSCTVTFPLGNKAFAEYQPVGYGELNLAMSGDFDYGGAYSNATACVANTTSYERAEFWIDGTYCLGTYSTGYQDCIDRTPPGWPINITNLIADKNGFSVTADTSRGVNYDPGCGYYYHFWYHIRAKVRNYVEPEPTVIVPTTSEPDVARTAYYISDALDTGETSLTWGPISWSAKEPEYTAIKVYVRTSDDGAYWTDWYEVSNGATISAPEKRYIQYKVEFYVFNGASDFPTFDNLKIVYYTGIPVFTLVTPTNLVLSTNDPNPYRCGALAQGAKCWPEWNTVPKERGKYELLMEVNSDCGFEDNSNIKIVYVFARTQILNFTADKNVVAKGDPLTLTGQVVDELGDPVARRTVRFYDNNVYIGETTTADDGTFSFTFTVPLDANIGYHTLKVVFPRDGVEYYWESEATTVVKYSSRPQITDVNVIPSLAGIGDSVVVEATVTDEVGISSVTIEINAPNGTTYTGDMSCSGTYCSYEFNDTWAAEVYSFTIKATNLDSIVGTYSGTFAVEGYATFGAQVEQNVYGALEDVLQWNEEYWGNPLSTYSIYLDANGNYGKGLSITTVIPASYNPFGVLSSYEFVRYDGAEVNTSYGPGHDGNALILSGNGYVLFPITSHLEPEETITIAGWIRIDSTVGDRYVFSLTAADGNIIYALYSQAGTSNICFVVRSGGVIYSTCSGNLATGTWHFVVGSFDGEVLRIYVNGSLANYTSLPAAGTIDYTGVADFATIGAHFNGSGFDGGWVGGIDELRIYTYVLNDTEIKNLMNGALVKKNPNGYWKFENDATDANPHKENPIYINYQTDTETNITAYVEYVGIKNDAAISGATSTEGVDGNAAYFNGAATITYTTADIDLYNTFSVALWVYPEANAGILVNKGYNNNPSWKLELLPNGRVQCVLRDALGIDHTVTSSTALLPNAWSHVACVYDREYLRIFVNGVEENRTRIGSYGSFTNTFNLVVGSGFTGKIDDLRVYHFPISAKDVLRLYNHKDVPWGLSIYQSFDTNVWDDESGDWLVPFYSGGWPQENRDEAKNGIAVTISGSPVKIWKRAAICNTGNTNISGYLYVDVQTGAGATWTTVPPITLNDVATGTKRTIPPGTCLDIAKIYNADPWNTDNQPAGTYRIRMILLKAGGNPTNPSDYITLSDGKKIVDYSEFQIVSASLSVSEMNHTHLAEYNLNEYETTDTISWIDVSITAKNSAAVDTSVTLTLTDLYKAYAGFGPNKETVYYGTIPEGETVTKRWDNGGVGYYIPENASPGTYVFHWLVEMNAANAPYTEDFTRYVTIHNLPYEFNSTAPTRIYYSDTEVGWGIYSFYIKNPWSRAIRDVNVAINCPSGVGITCVCVGGATNVCHLGDINAGDGVWVDFNIIVSTTAVSGDYNFDVNVEYVNPANHYKFWPHQQRRVIEIRKKGILEILLSAYPTDIVRGEDNAVFISKAHNTGTVNDENSWIAYIYPSDWVVLEKNTDGTFVGSPTDVNAFKSLVPPDGNIELNVVFDIPANATLGPRLVRIETGTATDPTWGDFKNVYVTVWDRPDINLEANDYNASVGESIKLIAHLTYSDGTPIANQRIYFEKNGFPLGAADTNADGYAVYVWDLSAESPGTYIVTARYDGNTSVYTLSAEANITVNIGLPPEINASVSETNVGYGIDVTIEANVTDDQGIKSVWATITEPNGNEYNVTLSLVAGNTYRGIFRPWKEGQHTIVVYAQDLYDSIAHSNPLYVYATAWANIGVETDKNYYLQGELVELNAPNWWNPNWKYRIPITITNNSSTALTNYQVKVSIDTESLINAGKMRWDLGDVRFVYNNTELNYWWEEVQTTEVIIPRASDDLDPYTADLYCSENPTYKYYYCAHPCEPVGWYETTFDDSSWLSGPAPFGGNGGECTTVLTSAPDDLFVRKWFYIPGEPLEANLWLSIDDGVRCYINGHLVIDDITAAQGPTYWNYGPIEINVAYLHEGNNLLACWVANGGENTGTGSGYFDAKLVVKYIDYANPDSNFWVVVPYVPANGQTTIYMYYGNPEATSKSDVNSVFPPTTLQKDCAGSVAGGSCTVKFGGTTDGYAFAPYQDKVEMNFLMSGDFDIGGAYSDPTTCVEDTTNERAMVFINGACYGTYSTGFQDCIDRAPAGWPIDVTNLVKGAIELNATGDAFPQVNYDPGCGYYYHFVWVLKNVRIRKYVSPEPTVSVGSEETLSGSYVLAGRTFRGYILGIIERNTATGWVYVDTDINDLSSGTLRTFTEGNIFDLSLVWNDWNTYGQPQGTYRARITLVGPDGSPLTYNGSPLENWGIFEIGPPPVDVSITNFRVYDVSGAANPRIEGNLIDYGLEKTIYLPADRQYRIEIDVTVGPTSNDWNIADSNVLHLDLNSAWNVSDIWYTLPSGVDMNGGTFDGNVEWNTVNDGTASASQTVTFKYIVDLNTHHAEEHNTTIKVTHPPFIERSDWVVLSLYVPDTIPPEAVEYNLVNTVTGQTGQEINVIRYFEGAKIYAEWNEAISDAYVEFNSTSSVLTTDTIVPDGNYTEYNFVVTSFWLLGPHVAKIHAADLSGNWNHDLNFLTFYVWGLARVASIDINDTNVYVGDTVEINCTVVDPTNSNSPIPNYPVHFYDNGTYIGTAYTNASGVASITYTFTSYGEHVLECNVDMNAERWYQIDPPNNEKNVTIFIKEFVPPQWWEVNYPTKVHRGEIFETNAHWTDNYKIDTVRLFVRTYSPVPFLPGWKYRRLITVTNPNAYDLNNFQVLITLDTQSLILQGKLRSDCGDLRFTEADGITTLPYWIEGGCGTSETFVWVKVPSIPANGETNIYVYYGNPTAASESNIDAVMIRDAIHLVTGRCTDATYCGYTDDHNEFDYIRSQIGTAPFTIDGNGYTVAIDDNVNPYGLSDYYYARYRFIFVAKQTGTYTFYTNSDDASEAALWKADGYGGGYYTPVPHPYGEHNVVSYWYGGHAPLTGCGTGGVAGSVTLSAGQAVWIDYMMTEWLGGQLARLCVSINGGTPLVLSTTNFPGQLYARKYADKDPGTAMSLEESYWVLVDQNKYDTNDVWSVLRWSVPTTEKLGLHQWYEDANDWSGNRTETNEFNFYVWGWSHVANSFVNPPAVNPDENVVAGCLVKDRDLLIPLEHYDVNFYYDGNYIGTVETNADGWAVIEINVGSVVGLHEIKCTIGPDPTRYYDPWPDENYALQYVNVTTSSDTDPPDVVEYNIIDINTGVEGKEINAYRGDELNLWAIWDENLSAAWAEYSIDGVTTTTKDANVNGTYADVVIETNSSWTRGRHRIIMYAKDEANNISVEANSADTNVYVWVWSNVKWVSPTGTVNKNSDMNAVCRVYEGDTNAGIPGYTVYFYSDLNGGTFLGTAVTDADGYATLFVDLNQYYGYHTFWCEIGDWPAEYYDANVDYDSETIYVGAINLKAVGAEVNDIAPREGDIVAVDFNVFNEEDACNAWIEVNVYKWDGSAWNLIDRNLYYHAFSTSEWNIFTYYFTAYPGRYKFVWTVDFNNAVAEDNEADNNAEVLLDVNSWATLWGEVNLEPLLGTNATVYYQWIVVGRTLLAYDYDAVVDFNLIKPMKSISDLQLADQELNMTGNPDPITSKYDTDGDGNIDHWHVFYIGTREINAPTFYVDLNFPVGIAYSDTDDDNVFDPGEPIVFMTDVYEGGTVCSFGAGICEYVIEIPSPLKKQFPPNDRVVLTVSE